MKNLDLITVGDVSLDAFIAPDEAETMCTLDEKECVVCFKYGDKIPVNSLNFSMGGNASNNAVGASRLGLSVAIVTTIGGDITGKQIVESLNNEKVNMSLVTRDEKGHSNYSTVINYGGERTIFSYHAPKTYTFPKQMPNAKWLYLTSLGDGWEEVFRQTLEWLNTHTEVSLAFNPGSKQLRVPVETLMPVLSKCHLLYVNREEAEHLSGMSSTEGKEKDLLQEVSKLGPKIVVITDGPAGAYVYEEGKFLYAPTFPQEVVERTGAGDSFGVGCLAALIKGKSLSEALIWGAVNSASVIGKIGAQAGLLNEQEMNMWFEKATAQGIMVKEL